MAIRYKKCTERHKKIVALTKKGYKRFEVAAMLGITTGTVSNALRPAGLLAKHKVIGGKRGRRNSVR